MKVAILSSSLSRTGGGVSEVALRISQHISKLPGISVEAFGLHDEEITNDRKLWAPLRITTCSIVGPSSFGYSPQLIATLRRSGADLIHLHGLWQYPSIACLKSQKPYLTTIHGMLDQWAIKNSGVKKRIAAFFYENVALRRANCLQAFTMQELSDIRNFGLKNPVCIIPNGVDIPEVEHLKTITPDWKRNISVGVRTLLYLGRIHPKKGLTNLIKAWKKIQGTKAAENWQLVVAGWDQQGYEQELKQLTKELELENSVHFIGAQFNDNKKLTFLNVDAFILPSFSEGLPMAVLEAWSYKLPVLMTKHCNLPEGFSANAAIEITPEVDSISKGMIDLFSEPETNLKQIGTNGSLLVREKFSWQNVATELHQVYKWIAGTSPMPESIILH